MSINNLWFVVLIGSVPIPHGLEFRAAGPAATTPGQTVHAVVMPTADEEDVWLDKVPKHRRRGRIVRFAQIPRISARHAVPNEHSSPAVHNRINLFNDHVAGSGAILNPFCRGPPIVG